MSFLSDIGGFLGEVQEFNQHIDAVKQEVTSSVVDVITQGKDLTDQVTSQVSDSATAVGQAATDVADDIKQTVND